jgi:preprotein translocase subunit SecF
MSNLNSGQAASMVGYKSSLGGRLYRGEKSFDFIKHRKRWYSFSALLIIVSIIALSVSGLKLGIEFKGGAQFTITKQGASVAEGQKALSDAGYTAESVIQKVGGDKLQIQTGALSTAQVTAVENSLAQKFGVSLNNIDNQIIGPSWGSDITHKAVQGLIGFLICVMLYLALAFEPKMAISAIVAVIHDVVITVGVYALVGFDVTPATVIGFLTILGYSLYDTVVVFDKVRENTKNIVANGKVTYSQAANLAVNQTLVRSFNTSLIALLPVASILFVGAGLLGAGTLKDLSLALFVGLAIGTYSSIFVATPLLAQLREREPAMKALAKKVSLRGAVGKSEGIAASVGERTSSIPTLESGDARTDWQRGPRNQPRRSSRRNRRS